MASSAKLVDTNMKRGFTLVELLLVIGIFALLAVITSLSFFTTVAQTDLSAAEDVLIADLKTKQANAMSGRADTSWALSDSTTLPQGVSLSTTFPSNTITFAGGTGEVVGFTEGSDTLTLSGTQGSRTVELNKYGTIIGE